MVRYIFAVSLLLLISISSGSAYAQSLFEADVEGMTKRRVGTPSAVRVADPTNIQDRIAERQRLIEERRAEIQERVELRKEKIATRVAEVRRRIAERRKAIIRRFFKRMLFRFQAAINRMRRIADRIEARLTKMEGRGIDVSELREELASVRENIDLAEGLLEGLEQKLEEALAADDPQAAFGLVRETVQEVRDLLVDIHRKLVEIITKMGKLIAEEAKMKEAETEATVSAQTGE